MEESEKRRQRLMAMRMEAAQTGVYNGPEASGFSSGGLSNPLIENEAISTTSLQYNAPRFDFYTDPMSAFSGNKRNNIPPQGHHSIPPRTPYQDMPPGPIHQNPGPRTFGAPASHFNRGPPRSPMEPFSRPQMYPPRAWGPPPPNFYQGNNFTDPRFVQGGPGPPRVQMEVARPQGNPPRPWGGPGNTFNYTPPPNSYPSFGNQGRSQGYGSGRGRGRAQTSGSGLSGRKGGRGHGSDSAELRPDKYYSKQMVEDPWELMSPVIWEHQDFKQSDHPKPTSLGGEVQNFKQSGVPKPVISTNKEIVEDPWEGMSLVTWEHGGGRDSGESWPPKTISMKKAKYMSRSSNEPSLAEYLAASFNDPIDGNEQIS